MIWSPVLDVFIGRLIGYIEASFYRHRLESGIGEIIMVCSYFICIVYLGPHKRGSLEPVLV